MSDSAGSNTIEMTIDSPFVPESMPAVFIINGTRYGREKDTTQAETKREPVDAHDLRVGDKFHTPCDRGNLVVDIRYDQICWWHARTGFCSGTADYLNREGGLYAIIPATVRAEEAETATVPVKPLHQRVTVGCEVRDTRDGKYWWISAVDSHNDMARMYDNRHHAFGYRLFAFTDLDEHFTLVEDE